MEKCSFCKEKASVICICSKYCCDAHIATHLQEEGEHLLSQISYCLDFQQREDFNAKIFQRLKLIIACQNEIMLKTKGLINKINHLAGSALRKLAKIYSFYLSLVIRKDYKSEDLEKVQNILKTELIKIDKEIKNPLNISKSHFSKKSHNSS